MSDLYSTVEGQLALLETLLRNAPVGFAFVDTEFRFLRVNDVFVDWHLIPANEHIGKTVEQVVPQLWPALEPLYLRALAGETVLNQEISGITNSGASRSWLVSYYPVHLQNQVFGIGIIVNDITERVRIEEELKTRNHLYAMLSRTNRAISQIRSRDNLFKEICNIAVETGRFKFAWVGVPSGNHVVRAASAGADGGYLDELAITMDRAALNSAGPTGQSILSGELAVENDFFASSLGTPWHELAIRAGFAATAAFPLKENGQVAAVLTLCAAQQDFFTNSLLATLSEITPSISFALDGFLFELKRKNAEVAASRLAAIVESASEAIIGKDLQSIITSWNKGAEKVFGYSASEMIGKSILRIIPNDRYDEAESMTDRIVSGEGLDNSESRRLTKDGRLIDVVITASPIRDSTGDIIGASNLVRDITAQKQAEEARRATEARYRSLFENAPDGIVIADSNSCYLDANASICDMLGYSRDELIGLYASDIVAQKEIQYIEPALSSIKATSNYYREWEFRRKNSSTFIGEVNATVMPDGNILGMIRDATQRKEAENRIYCLNRVYSVLSNINHTIVREKDPQVMMDMACRIAVEKGQMQMAWIGLVDELSGKLGIAAHAGADQDALNVLTDLLGQEKSQCKCAFTLQALLTGQCGVCNDIANDPEADLWRDEGLKRNYRAMASLPIKKADEVIGTFNIYSDCVGFFNADEMKLLEELAMDVSFGLEVREREAELRRRDQQIVDERTRLAREIHDTLAQGLTGIVIQLQVADRSGSADSLEPDSHVRLARQLAEECLIEARRAVQALRPSSLENHGLTYALQKMQEQMTSRVPIHGECNFEGTPYPLSAQVENNLLRIGQEAMTNALRHSQARNLNLTLAYREKEVRLRVEDDGGGFAQAPRQAGGFGLVGIRERAAEIGAELAIDSHPGRGTRIEVIVPTAIKPQ